MVHFVSEDQALNRHPWAYYDGCRPIEYRIPTVMSPPFRPAIYVDGERGDDVNGDGSCEKPFRTLARAFDERIEYEI
jgi:hypothetical protein